MSDHEYFWYALLAASVVTYPLRAIPATLISKLNLSLFLRRFLDLVPYTALTALVFPGVFYCVQDHMYAAACGTAAAVLSALLRLPQAVTVACAVIAVYLVLVAG